MIIIECLYKCYSIIPPGANEFVLSEMDSGPVSLAFRAKIQFLFNACHRFYFTWQLIDEHEYTQAIAS